jgi:hypothetical protein
MRRRLSLVEKTFALSAEAIMAPLEAYDPAFEELWGDPYEAGALRQLRSLLRGGAKERRPYQAPVSYRILPRLIGQLRRAIAQAEGIAESSLQSVTDNPVFLAPDEGHPLGRVCSNGGFHNARAYPALDNLAAACADLCALAERHTTKLLDGRYSLLRHSPVWRGRPRRMPVGAWMPQSRCWQRRLHRPCMSRNEPLRRNWSNFSPTFAASFLLSRPLELCPANSRL